MLARFFIDRPVLAWVISIVIVLLGGIAAGLLPQRRMGEGCDVAKAVRAIADGLLDYSTGQILNVDGGFSLRSL